MLIRLRAGNAADVSAPDLVGARSESCERDQHRRAWPGLFGGLFGYRREMSDSSLILMRLGAVSMVGGGVGAWLLIVTPSPIFARLVPFLILFATVLFMLQGPVNRWLHVPSPTSGSQTSWWTIAIIVQFFSAVYGGYFGAGNGIWMLAAMGLLGLHDIHRANGIKNFLGICINSVAVIAFAISHLVEWRISLLMAVAALLGGYVGARTARRWSLSHSPRDCRDWICDYGSDVVADEVKR